MLKINKLKKIKSNFPVIVGEQIISKKVCNSLIKEISNSKNFDDMIMGGRSRINKGSKNFNKYISSSKISKKLFATFNTESFYKKIDKKFKKEFKANTWESLFKPKKFNQKKYTLKRKVNSKELKRLLGKNYKNPNLNLDIDFSVSKGGYRLRPHRDDINRIYNFLIYLTDIPKKMVGLLLYTKKKLTKTSEKVLEDFPKIMNLIN